ncbi:ribonucleotide reductase 1 [Diatraea saccharalis granulovirus]|uniref:Ribonucleotide reductase 1 n=1 Tax=Diatraea saccharalis granulovirus TaxID=1675862 RepID=A0A0R7EZ05_9BBAC|nr:ribonucleotide reductase 1 [Diatraea saccharalis granulovirus]AKN80821.1 ribonucleotide reductase 1 [Diatraea saccharalis granulovirus]
MIRINEINMNGRINNLQGVGKIVLKERMMKINETEDEFVTRMGKSLTQNHPTKSMAVGNLLRSLSIIPSSAVCQYFNDNKETANACELFVFGRSQELSDKLKEMWCFTEVVVKDTGVGVGADNIESKNNSFLFYEVCKFLNQSINLVEGVRKSRLALYLSIHNINAYICLMMRQKNDLITPNVFYGILIPDIFMTTDRDTWYFFDGSATLNGKSLNDCYGDEYETLYWKMVEMGMFVKQMPRVNLMGELVSCLTENGFPYIVWRDTVNRYNNQSPLGTIQTLNLCAEVCQYADNTPDSQCTLLTLNVAAFKENYVQLWDEIDQDLMMCSISKDCLPPLDDPLLSHCFYGAYMSTFVLNYLLSDKKRREIGVSPTGLFDAICIKYGIDAAYDYAMEEYSGIVAEYIYIGCVIASVVFNRLYNVKCVNFEHSMFSLGLFQFDLRCVEPTLKKQWDLLRPHVRGGMSNSMLTAQAPTATTSLITNVTESVQFPMPGPLTTKNSNTGRFADMPYYLTQMKNDTNVVVHKNVPIRQQVKVYANMAPFVDQSQSVILNCLPENDEVMKVLWYTFREKLKTGIYYLSFVSPTNYIQMGNNKEINEGCSVCSL